MHKLALFLAIFVLGATALEYVANIKYPFNDDPTIVTSLVQYGFLVGGTVTINVTRVDNTTSPTLRFLVCTENTACSDNNCDYPSLCLFDELINSSLSTTVNIREAGSYLLQMADTEKQDYQIEAYFHLMNPGGEELPYGDIPRYALRIVLAGVWFVLLVMWIGNSVMYWSHSVKLHRLLAIYPILKIAFCICASIFWVNRSHGLDITIWPYIIFYVATRVSFLTLILIAASGWGIHRKEFGKDRYFILGSAAGLISTLILAYTIHSIFMVFSAIIYLVSVVMVFRYFNRSMIEIIQHYHDVNPIFEIFYRLRIVFYALLCSFMLATLFQVLFLASGSWVSDMLNEVLEIATCLAIGYVLRLKQTNVYGRWLDANDQQPEPVEVELGALQGRQQAP